MGDMPTYIAPVLNKRTIRLMVQRPECVGMFMAIVSEIHHTDEEITTRKFDSKDWTTSVGIKRLTEEHGCSVKSARRQLDRLVEIGVITINVESIPEIITLTLDDTNLSKTRHG